MNLIILRFFREVDPTPGPVTLRFGEVEGLQLGSFEAGLEWSLVAELTEGERLATVAQIEWQGESAIFLPIELAIEGAAEWALNEARLRQFAFWSVFGDTRIESELFLRQFERPELALTAALMIEAGIASPEIPLRFTLSGDVVLSGMLSPEIVSVTPLFQFGTIGFFRTRATLTLPIVLRTEGGLHFQGDLILGPVTRWSDCALPVTAMSRCEPAFGQGEDFHYIYAGETEAALISVGIVPALRAEKTGVYSFIIINAAQHGLSTPWEECSLPIVDAWGICDTSPNRS